MQVIKKLNNNFAICMDKEGKELIAYGKGIGFPKVPYELTDLNQIDRTFYDIDDKYLDLLQELPEKVLDFAAKLVDIAHNELQYELNPNLVMTLADHIHFCIQRARKKIVVQMPLISEIEQSFPKEAKIGKYAVRQMERRFAVQLNENEASGIAISFANARNSAEKKADTSIQKWFHEALEDTISIVEDTVGILIERESFNFARYSSHLMYLLKRIDSNQTLDTDNGIMYQSIREEFPEIAECIDKIEVYFEKRFDIQLSKEEKMYLMLHINRICVREGL
ncbi:PRD domain-containing protein [[Ruminococcus] torques]|uniref:PRD domain-containing protein n=1 Tax=[Ruminococcus] torques TaxID=33039 RepID=UPI001D060CDC|nr:PRD domain-containing protein [[Ruminococcus] torques]MCB6637306.1 PRD domain-containing protein [[Ruminococcus] torques]MCB7324612.1 PRD domain-containing protein [[Ruminococcus] torques]